MKNKLIELMNENDGILTTKAVSEAGYPRFYITQMVRQGLIERVASGVYADVSIFYDDYYVFQLKHPNTYFSHNTALYFHNMTERTPDKLDVSVVSGTNTSKYSQQIRTYYCSKRTFDLGIELKRSPYGREVRCTDLERSLCDIIRNSKGIDQETRNKSIKEILRSGQINENRLLSYAKTLKCIKQLTHILEYL